MKKPQTFEPKKKLLNRHCGRELPSLYSSLGLELVRVEPSIRVWVAESEGLMGGLIEHRDWIAHVFVGCDSRVIFDILDSWCPE